MVLIILKFTGEGEIFYFQERVGIKQKKIVLIKFATMLKNSPNIGTGTITIKDDPRIFSFGKFLRKTKINEIPQLINVLKGDMSLIGPRPLTIINFNMYSKKSREILSSIRPGLSGIGSIIFRNEEEILNNKSIDAIKFYSNEISPYKAELEEWFVNRYNFKTYIILIVLTILVILKPNSKLIWKIFPSLPTPKKSIQNLIGYTN